MKSKRDTDVKKFKNERNYRQLEHARNMIDWKVNHNRKGIAFRQLKRKKCRMRAKSMRARERESKSRNNSNK